MSKKYKYASIFTIIFAVACGTSIYKPLSKNDSNQALKEDAIIAMEDGNYSKSTELLEKIYNKEKSNEIVQLYSASLLGKAGFNMFGLIRKALEIASRTDDQNGTGTENVVINQLVEEFSNSLTDEDLNTVKQAIDVLAVAPNQNSSSLEFQKCLTGALYAAPQITKVLQSVEEIKTSLQTLPTKLQSSGGGACGASSSQISEAGAEVNGLITKAGNIGKTLADVVAIAGSCLADGDAQTAANEIQNQMNKLISSADKGCSIPQSQTLGNLPLPSCMNSYITSASQAVANDGQIDGCEIFINCTSGECF